MWLIYFIYYKVRTIVHTIINNIKIKALILMAISHRPPSSSSGAVLARRCRLPSSSASMSKISTSAFYPLHLHISSAKFIRNLPAATSAHPHFTIGLIPHLFATVHFPLPRTFPHTSPCIFPDRLSSFASSVSTSPILQTSLLKALKPLVHWYLRST